MMKAKNETSAAGGASGADQSLAYFFNKLSEKLDQIPGSARTDNDQEFEMYSQALQGFAQNNVSKASGFSMKVKIDKEKEYNELLEKLIKQKTSP